MVSYKGILLEIENREFELFLAKAIIQEPCWGWIGGRQGSILRPCLPFAGRSFYAHIFSYLWYVGSVDVGLYVCHSCDNLECTNPLHLWLGTQKDNVLDCIKKGRRYKSRRQRNLRSCIS